MIGIPLYSLSIGFRKERRIMPSSYSQSRHVPLSVSLSFCISLIICGGNTLAYVPPSFTHTAGRSALHHQQRFLQRAHNYDIRFRSIIGQLSLTNTDPDNIGNSCSPFDADLIKAAEAKLPWEISAEQQAKPVLDLSGLQSGGETLDLSEEAAVARDSVGKDNSDDDTTNTDNSDVSDMTADVIDWQSGEIWSETRRELSNRSILPKDDATERENEVISACPQLIRLPTEDIVATADEAINALGLPPAALASHLAILTYPAQFLPGAIEFLSNMMMTPQPAIQSLCRSNPQLLIGGLDGYVQEQAVKNALGSAGDALYGVGRSVASDLGSRMRDKGKPKGL